MSNSGKVKCTCGWSWNKSDSSKKDMYVCHECGRDNSNNLSKAQDGIQTMSSKDKRGYELLIQDTENAKKDQQEFFTKGYIKNPRSVKNKKAKKELEKNQTSVTQDNRTDAVRKIDEEKGKTKEFKKTIKPVIQAADVATDIMQLGNFVPHPIGQAIGKIGNVAGTALDAYQVYDDLSEGNYTGAAINAGSVFLPMALGSKTFRRNSKYLQPGQPLYPFSPQANLPANATISMRLNAPQVDYIEPFNKVKGMTDASLLANRALLGTLGAETIYDIPKQKNGGWLDNYNDSQVSLPEGFVGEGTFNGPKFDNPAWGGQFKEGGKVDSPRRKVIAESTGVYKKPFNEKELKNIIKDDVEYRRTGDIKNPRAEANKFEKFLPNKKTANFFKKMKKEAGPAIFKEALKIQHERGNPSINVGTDKGLPFSNRRNYNPFTNEVNIPADSPGIYENHIYDYLKEVSHAGQPLSKVVPKFLTNDIPGYVKAYISKGNTIDNIEKYVYDNSSTVENYTHSKIQPELEQRINSAYSWPMSKEEELEDLNFTLKYGLDKKQMGGNIYPVNYVPEAQRGMSIPGAVGHIYARYEGGGEIDYPRTKNIPSEGKYAKKTLPSAQNGQEMQYYREGLDWKPKSISEDGSIIKDDMGQWKYPGEITEIGSNQITMQGVPYDVLGVSDTGDVKLMKPGKNYKFKGKKVTEFPMAKNGINKQDQKTFEQLDQLTNFTNYNKPTVGGWLNKYN